MTSDDKSLRHPEINVTLEWDILPVEKIPNVKSRTSLEFSLQKYFELYSILDVC